MPITQVQIAPLLAESYADASAAWSVMERLIVPGFGAALASLARRGHGLTPRGFALEVLAEFGRRVIEKRGIRGPKPPPPADHTSWLRTVLLNTARDHLRKLDRTRRGDLELDESRHPSPGAEPPVAPPDNRQQRLDALARHSPLYLIALYCWTDPAWIKHGLLEAAAAVPSRGRSTTGTGLARSVDETLRLLHAHRTAIASGADRNAAVQQVLAWILRSDAPDFAVWQQDRRAVIAARETLSKWYQRARRQLETDREPEEDE